MIDPQEARDQLHRLIDMMPDEQVALAWVALQTMFNDDYPEEADSDRTEQSEEEDGV